MRKSWRFVLCAFLFLPVSAFSMQDAGKAKTKPAANQSDTATPTASQIADAKTQGRVWVNLGTGVYHKDGEFYGKTKRGKFMTESEAQKGGYRASKEPKASKKSAPPKNTN